MLWDLIRDFFVQHIFGGSDSLSNVYHTKLGDGISFLNGELDEGFSMGDSLYYNVSKLNDGSTYCLSLSDWLSTTATIISITIIVVLCCLFVYKIVKLIGGLIR